MPHRDDLVWALWFGSEEQANRRLSNKVVAPKEEWDRYDAIVAEASTEYTKRTGIKVYGDQEMFDNTQASKEGWSIFSTNDAHRPFQLQRCDEAEIFPDDLAAWSYVARQILRGSEYHQSAILFLAKHSPREYNAFKIALFPQLGDFPPLSSGE
jgi:hypothetical protein